MPILSLAKIQEFRNLWAHPDTDLMTLSILRKLASAIVEFYGINENNLVEYCNFILSFNEADGEAMPKILVNSSIFKRHVSNVDNIMKSIDENANLMGKIIDLNKKMEEYKKNGVDGKSLVPGYTSTTYEDLLESNIMAAHMATGFVGAYYVMNLKLGIANMKRLILIKNSTKNKEVKLLIENYEKSAAQTLKEEVAALTELRSSMDFPEGCDCQFCSSMDPSAIGVWGPVSRLEEFIDEISSMK